ncbi:MAG: hypothetical protein ACJ75J_07485 [Cytophagaceae bacterium]|jgi:hypothetical protein
MQRNHFYERMNKLDDNQLIEALQNPSDYQPEALQAIEYILYERGKGEQADLVINKVKANRQRDEEERNSLIGDRPWPITVICVLIFIGSIVNIWILLSGFAKQIADWYPPYLAFSFVIGIACLIGFFRMQKWAVYLYTGVFVLNEVVVLSTGLWTVLSLLPLIVIVILFSYMDRMRSGEVKK